MITRETIWWWRSCDVMPLNPELGLSLIVNFCICFNNNLLCFLIFSFPFMFYVSSWARKNSLKLKESKYTPTEAPLPSRKYCSWMYFTFNCVTLWHHIHYVIHWDHFCLNFLVWHMGIHVLFLAMKHIKLLHNKRKIKIWIWKKKDTFVPFKLFKQDMWIFTRAMWCKQTNLVYSQCYSPDLSVGILESYQMWWKHFLHFLKPFHL